MNLGDHRQAILDELSKTSSDTFHTTAILNRFINRAVQWAANLKNWQQTQIVRKQALTLVGDETDEYWDYPSNFKTDSIYRIAVGTGTIASDQKYRPLVWEEYLDHKETDPTSEKIWADHRRQVFIYPVVTGAPVLSLWGHEIPAQLVADANEHPFTGEQLIEEAINAYALSLALIKMRGSYIEQGNKKKAEAIALIAQAWDQQRKEQAKKQTLNAEAWEHTDFLNQRAGNRSTRRGSFNLDT